VRDDDECYWHPAGRWIFSHQLVLCDEGRGVVGVKRALDAHSLWRTHNELEVKLDERLNEWHAVEAAITVDAVDLDEFSSSGDEPANRLPQRAGVIRLDRFGCECESNGRINDTERHKCVREVCSAVWIDRTDVRCVVRSVVEPFVNV